VEAAIERSGGITAGTPGAAVALAAGAAAFLVGDAAIRRLLRIGLVRLRRCGRAGPRRGADRRVRRLEVQVAALTLLLAGTLVLERNQSSA